MWIQIRTVQLQRLHTYSKYSTHSHLLSIATATHHYRRNGLKQYKFIVFHFLKSEVQMDCRRPLEVSIPKVSKIKCCAPSGDSWEESVSYISQLLETICFLWLVTPFLFFEVRYSIFKSLSNPTSLATPPSLTLTLSDPFYKDTYD